MNLRFVTLFMILTAFGSMSYAAKAFHEHSFKDSDGKTINFSKYKGKTLLVVNTATGCGYTPQLRGMQKLAKSYDEDKFEVLGFPSNSFNQESLNDKKIKDFCFLKYGAKFTLFEKSDVRGKNTNPIFEYLVQNSSTPKKEVPWNFEKFVVDPNGKVIGRFRSNVKPNDSKIIALIEKNVK